mmetsp:Transcript_30001/g.72809  ORF Transcript_30001/g.72809 Transcript_30001/m.72809 type:complete len:831 (+) Transcript_30001:71-2563(+)
MSSSSSSHSFLTDAEARPRLEMIRSFVARPIPPNTKISDECPALIDGTHMCVGNKYHASKVPELVALGVTHVLNCASGGISRLPMDEILSNNIHYNFTNVRRDDHSYPILFDPKTGEASKHLQSAKALYADVVKANGRVLFFCVAGQNRSPTLAISVCMLFGHELDDMMKSLSKSRPFVLENTGFQRQLVELEAMLKGQQHSKKIKLTHPSTTHPLNDSRPRSSSLAEIRRQISEGSTSAVSSSRRSSNSMSTDNESTNVEKKDDDGGGGGGDNDEDLMVYVYGSPTSSAADDVTAMMTDEDLSGMVEVELLIPGLCTMDVVIQSESTIAQVKDKLVAHANEFLLSYSTPKGSKIGKSWLVLAMFGFDDMYDFPIEDEAIEQKVQLELMQQMFGLEVFFKDESKEPYVKWNSKCRFALVIFSVYKALEDGSGGHQPYQEPWTFVHEERPGAPATFLEYNLLTTHLRGWDFVTGEPFASLKPIVFSFSPDSRDKRQFMKISTSANTPVQFHAPGEGNILGMGANAIVHRVELGKVLESTRSNEPDFMDDCPTNDRWDSAVKRHFSLDKMISFLESRSEAGLAKRIRMASSLNSDGRVVEFYGLGVGLASNSSNENEYKFEAMLLSRYEENFSTYTMRKFMEEYLTPLDKAREDERDEIETLQANFSIMSVKVLLVSLLNAFRDLTLMGVQAFDFNHLSNVLVSRDHRLCRLIDIDGDSKGSIQLDDSAQYMKGHPSASSFVSTSSPRPPTSHRLSIHKPSLEIDLNTVLPTLVEQMILGKGRGRSFVANKRSEIWHSNPEKARDLIMEVLQQNFYPDISLRSENEIFKAGT